MKKSNEELRTTLENIQQIIKAQRYDEARALLEDLDAKYDNNTVKKWLQKLDELAPIDPVADMEFPEPSPLPVSRGGAGGGEKPKREKKKRGKLWWAGAVFVSCIALTLCSIIAQSLGIIPSTEERNATRTLDASTQIAAQSFATMTQAAIPTNTLIPTIAPTDTPIPTATPIPTDTPIPTNTPVPSPTPMPIIFSSSDSGLQPVIGPVDIPTGLYRVTATTQGFMIVEVDTVSGTCEHNMLGNLFNLSQGQATSGAEAIFASNSCRALIKISNTQQNWTLSFEAITPLDVTDIQPHYDSNTEGLQAVIGPVRFQNGQYRVTATTTGFIIAKVETISGTCDDGILGLFNLSQGQASSGAQNLLKTTDCLAFIQVHNTQEHWTLDFELLQ